MTVGQRALLEKFSGGDRPLNRAIAAALHEIDRLRACRQCHGAGQTIGHRGDYERCEGCSGTGRKR